MDQRLSDLLPGRHVPEPGGPIVARGQDALAIGTERSVVHVRPMTEDTALLPAGDVPKLGAAVGAGGQGERTRRVEADGHHAVVMIESPVQIAACGHFPQPRRVILTTSQKTSTLRIECQRNYPRRDEPGAGTESCQTRHPQAVPCGRRLPWPGFGRPG